MSATTRSRAFARDYPPDLDEREQDGGDGGYLCRARPHQIDNELCGASRFPRDPITKMREHSLLKRSIRFFVFEFFFQTLIHNFVFVMGLAECCVFDEMRVQSVAFVIRELAVQVGRE